MGSIVFEHLFDLSGSTLVLDLLRAWLHACSTSGPKLPQADPKSDFPKTKFQPRLFCKTVRTLCKKRFQTESQPQKERGQKDAAAVFRVACSIRRSIRRNEVLLGVSDRYKIIISKRLNNQDYRSPPWTGQCRRPQPSSPDQDSDLGKNFMTLTMRNPAFDRLILIIFYISFEANQHWNLDSGCISVCLSFRTFFLKSCSSVLKILAKCMVLDRFREFLGFASHTRF